MRIDGPKARTSAFLDFIAPELRFRRGARLKDPRAAKTPQSAGTWALGNAYGGNWFVDPNQKLTVVILTNTALEGIFGTSPVEVRDAVHGSEPWNKSQKCAGEIP